MLSSLRVAQGGVICESAGATWRRGTDLTDTPPSEMSHNVLWSFFTNETGGKVPTY